MTLDVTHQLDYTYDGPVAVQPQTLYLYPRTYPYQRLLSYDLVITPTPGKIVRNVDVEGNVQQLVYFGTATRELRIEARMRLESEEFNSLDFVLYPFETQHVPFAYPAQVRSLLGPYLERIGTDDAVERWAKTLATQTGWQTVPFLLALNQAIRGFHYVVRPDGAPFPPEQTLREQTGSCRDYTLLFMAACRSLGIAARFVSGYLFGSAQQEHQLHAWAEVYLPGAGWRGFDPTENLVVMNQHIFLASSARADLTTPVSGKFTGVAHSSLTAHVAISAVSQEV